MPLLFQLTGEKKEQDGVVATCGDGCHSRNLFGCILFGCILSYLALHADWLTNAFAHGQPVGLLNYLLLLLGLGQYHCPSMHDT